MFLLNRFSHLTLITILSLCPFLANAGPGGTGGGSPSKMTLDGLHRFIEGDGLKLALHHYLKGLKLSHQDKWPYAIAFLNAHAFNGDLDMAIDRAKFVNQPNCRDLYSGARACTHIGGLGSPIGFDIDGLYADDHNLNKDLTLNEELIEVGKTAFHELTHQFQDARLLADAVHGPEIAKRYESEATEVGDYFSLHNKVGQMPVFEYSDSSADPIFTQQAVILEYSDVTAYSVERPYQLHSCGGTVTMRKDRNDSWYERIAIDFDNNSRCNRFEFVMANGKIIADSGKSTPLAMRDSKIIPRSFLQNGENLIQVHIFNSSQPELGETIVAHFWAIMGRLDQWPGVWVDPDYYHDHPKKDEKSNAVCDQVAKNYYASKSKGLAFDFACTESDSRGMSHDICVTHDESGHFLTEELYNSNGTLRTTKEENCAIDPTCNPNYLTFEVYGDYTETRCSNDSSVSSWSFLKQLSNLGNNYCNTLVSHNVLVNVVMIPKKLTYLPIGQKVKVENLTCTRMEPNYIPEHQNTNSN